MTITGDFTLEGTYTQGANSTLRMGNGKTFTATPPCASVTVNDGATIEVDGGAGDFDLAWSSDVSMLGTNANPITIDRGTLDLGGASGRTAVAAHVRMNNGPNEPYLTISGTAKYLRGEVAFVEPDSLPNDGKVIDDIRTYE